MINENNWSGSVEYFWRMDYAGFMHEFWNPQTQEKSDLLLGGLSDHCKPRATVRAVRPNRQVIDN